MLTRRGFAVQGFAGMMAAGLTEAVFAQRASVKGVAPADTVWLNGNEYPEGPPAPSVAAMAKIIGSSNRYHYQEFPAFYSAVAAYEKLDADQVLIGAGSTEVIHAAIEAFTGPNRAFITAWPTFEAGPELAAYKGFPVVKTPLTSSGAPDVRRLVAEAEKAGGGMIYICHPNNPTSVLTTRADMDWMVANLPKNTILLVDEAYLHYGTSPDAVSAMKYVHEGKDVIVTRTYSKIYAMAGLRAGFVAGRADLIKKMEPYRNNVISIVAVRAVLAALDLGPKLLEERRAKIDHTRAELCAWLKSKNIAFIPPQANFLMLDVKRDVREVAPQLLEKGVAVGRPFPPMDQMMRVTIGTDAEMRKFRSALSETLAV